MARRASEMPDPADEAGAQTPARPARLRENGRPSPEEEVAPVPTSEAPHDDEERRSTVAPHSEADAPAPAPAVARRASETSGEKAAASEVPLSSGSSLPAVAMRESDSSQLRDRRIGIIGAGAMGGALCRGLVHANAAPANRILVSDPHSAHVQNLQKALGIRVADSNSQVAKYTDIILLAVKPSMVAGVLDEIGESLRRDGGKPLPLLISIAAGVHIAKLEAHLKDPLPVVRAMPNTPAQVGMGACAYCRGAHVDDNHAAHAAEIFRSVGIAVEVPEALMDAVTALSGSGPAYVYLMIEALVDGGVKVGLPREIASQLAAQTVLGAAQMVIETGMHPAQLRDMVTTPAGTTIAALAGLEHSGVRAALIDAVERAAARSRELG